VSATKRDTCKHNVNTLASVTVTFVEDRNYYTADVEIRCRDCGTRFAFLGMQPGISQDRPMCSVGALEARLPIEPDAHATSLLAGIKEER
jgi:hypothetical protein